MDGGRRVKIKLTIIIWMIAAALLLVSACGPSADSGPPSVSVTVTKMPSAAPTPIPAPQPVTEIPSDFLPGLSEAGIIPSDTHHIGIIINGPETEAELQWICAAYQERFGITISAQVCSSAAQQQAAAKEMIGSGTELLIVEPSAEAPSGVDELCEQNGVSYISMGTQLDKTPGQGAYVCAIVRDEYLTGVLSGISIVQAMTEKYGKPRGNIAELAGVVTDETSIMRSRGLRRVFAAHDQLRVVCSMTGGDDQAAYAAAVNILKAYRAGELDGIVAVDDAAALQVLQAVLNYDRTELLGCIWTAGGTVDGMTGVWYGQFAQTVENTAFSGMTAIEYALQYLEGNGDEIPPVVTAVTRVFSAKTQEQKDSLAVLIAQLKDTGAMRCIESTGAFAPFIPDQSLLEKYYPVPWYEQDSNYLTELEPYTTEDAIYASSSQAKPEPSASNETEQPEAGAQP
jgi:ABC-type sugar transport system substrate-binding protein